VAEDGSLDEAGFLENLTRINQAKDRRPAPSELHPVPPPNPSEKARRAERDPNVRPALTDLFPPAEHERPPDPLRGTATGPVLPARRRAAEPVNAGDDSAGYETFYGFHDRPFGPAPDLRFLYHSAAHDAASEALLTAITRRDAVTVLTAPSGAGKTLLCAAVIDQLDRRTMTSVIRDPFLTLDDLLERMLIDFGVVSREDTRAKGGRHDALTAALQSFSSSLAPLQAAAVIVIDDAHRLAADVIDHLDILTSGGGGALVLILAGEPGLLKMLKRPALRALDERIAARVALGPLAGDEMPGYIAHRLRVAGDAARVQFDDDAIEVMYTLSKGVPGVVNAIGDRALSHGLESSAAVIDATLIEQASRDLGLVSARDRRAAILTLFFYLGLMLAGAATAAWLFWDKVERVLHRFNW
jgi:general secretion pathway protein A